MRARIRETAALAAVAALCVLLFGFRLGAHPLWDPDEAKHAEIAREMLVTGRLVEPLVNFEPYHHKPSLLYVLIGAAYRVFGIGELGARVVPAASAAATLLAVYLFARRRAAAQAWLATLLLAACGFFVAVGRFVNFDALLTFLMTSGVLALALVIEGRRAAITWFYAAVALAVLVKGPAALALAAVPAAAAWWRGDLSLDDLALRRGTAIVLVIVGAWLVPALVVAPSYVADFLWTHNVQRYLAPVGADVFHPEPFWFFLPVLAATLLPWSFLVPPALAAAFAAGGSRRMLADYALWAIVFFSLSSGKLATYILPAYPALALLVAEWLCEVRTDEPRAGALALRAGAALAMLLAPAAFFALGSIAPDLRWQATAMLLPAAAGASAALLQSRRSTLQATASACAGMAASVFLLLVFGAHAASAWTSDHDLALAAARTRPKPQRVIAYRVRPFSFLFYTGAPMQYRVPVEEVRSALYAPGDALLLTEDAWAWHLEEIAPGIEMTEIARNPRHVLFRVRSPWRAEP